MGASIIVTALIILVVAFAFWRRRKRIQTTPPYVIAGSNRHVDGKAELAGTEPKEGSRFSLTPKLELDGEVKAEPYLLAAGMPEMDGERREVVPELDSRAQAWSHASELGNEPRAVAAPDAQHKNFSPLPQSTASPPIAGPIPAASDLCPAPPPPIHRRSGSVVSGYSRRERDRL